MKKNIKRPNWDDKDEVLEYISNFTAEEAPYLVHVVKKLYEKGWIFKEMASRNDGWCICGYAHWLSPYDGKRYNGGQVQEIERKRDEERH